MKTLLKYALILLFLAGVMSAGTLNEGFDNVAGLTASGWVMVNNSNPVGTTGWFQGNDGIFTSQSGANDSYIAANYLNAGSGGNISNWLISPEMKFGPNTTLTFWTRTENPSSNMADRLELRMSTQGSSTNVGNTDSSVGDFDILLLTINPDLIPDGYPTDWTRVGAAINGFNFDGRFAFRYFVPDTNTNADYIGIDSVTITTPEPMSLVMLGSGLLGLAGFRKFRR